MKSFPWRYDHDLLHLYVLPHSQVSLPPDFTIRSLLPWITTNLLQERPELFVQGATVRPGILVLVNDADWELMGELDYQIEKGDKITFISTLHGG